MISFEQFLNEKKAIITGPSKPEGAEILASVIVDYLADEKLLIPSAIKNQKELIDDLQELIMNTF